MASILPPSFLQLQGACSSIASIFSAVTTAELQVPQTAPPSQSSEKMVESRLQAAKACKHEADQARGSKGWSTRTVIKYVEAALLFIEACEYLVRVPGENKQQISRCAHAVMHKTARVQAWTHCTPCTHNMPICFV